MLAEAREGPKQELLVSDRVPDLERGVPCGEHREIVVVELFDGLRIVPVELVVGDLVDPGTHDLAEQLAARLAPHALGDDPDRFLWLDEAERHLPSISSGSHD